MSTMILRLKISLKHIKPLIWRRVEVEDNITFYELHHVIQIVMGWWNTHLFEFTVNDYKIGIRDDEFYKNSILDATEIIVSNLIDTEKTTFYYVYDFGDNWVHEIVVEKILQKSKTKTYPLLTAGKRNCPPEDVLGFAGYMNFVNVMKNKIQPDYDDLVDWYGEEYDPEYFDVKETNNELQFIIKTKKWNPN